MDRTIVVRIANATEGNAAAWLFRTELALLVDGAPVPSKKTGGASRVFIVAPDAREIVLRVTVPARLGERTAGPIIEQTFVIATSGPDFLKPVSTLHPRLTVKRAGGGMLAQIDVDLKFIDITRMLTAESGTVRPESPASSVRFYEITSGQPRGWLAIGPLDGARTTPAWLLGLLRPALDPLQDALAHPHIAIRLDAYFGQGCIPWQGSFGLWNVTANRGSYRILRVAAMQESSSNIAVVPFLGSEVQLDAGQFRLQPNKIIGSLLAAVRECGMIASTAGGIASQPTPDRVMVAWAEASKRGSP